MKRRKLRILYVDETIGFGGGMVALRNLVAALNPAKYEAAIVVRAENRKVLAYLRDNLPDGIRIFPISRWTPSPGAPLLRGANTLLSRALGKKGRALLGRAQWLLGLIGDALPTALRIASIAKRWKADAIHTNEQILSNVAGILAAKVAGVACFSHNRMFGLPPRMAQHFIPWVTHFFAISDYIKRDLEQGGVPPSLITVVYDGVDLAQFSEQRSPSRTRAELAIPPECCVAGIFGRMVEWKGHEFFLKAFARACAQVPGLIALVVGDTSPPGGPLMQRLKAQAVALGIHDRVRFVGYRTDIARLMSATHIVVVPSVEPEPAGLVNFEAMAVSRPIIGTRIGGIPELVQDGVNGLLISAGDVEGFAEAILRLTRDPGLARRMGEEGRRIVERRFTNQMYADLVSKTYATILRPNGDANS